MLGDSATGKTGIENYVHSINLQESWGDLQTLLKSNFKFIALVNQFMTSEYMHTYDASLDDEFGEKTVSILLDGEESEMIFIDHPASEMSVSWCLLKGID